MAVTILSIPLGYVALAAVWAIVLYHIVRSKRAGLDHIPGPFLARYTDAWRAYQAWKTNHYAGGHNYQTRLLGKYGDVVRIGPNTVLVLDPEAINSVLGFKERLEKGPGYQVFVLPGTTQTALVGIKDEATHGKFRRPIANSFSLSSLKGYEPYIDDMIRALTDVLDQRARDGKPINMSRYLHFWSFDVMTKLTFGEPLGFIQHGHDFNGMIKSQKTIFRYISITNNWPTLDSLLKKNPLLRLVGKKPNMFFNFAQHHVHERLAKADLDAAGLRDAKSGAGAKGGAQQQHPDLLGHFIAARDTYPDIMSPLRITHYCQTNVVAGANNSALAMDQTICFLAKHPEAQERLRQEILSVQSAAKNAADEDDEKKTVENRARRNEDGPPALDLALKMRYLEAVIQESYRLFASPSNNLERVVSPRGLTLPNGVSLPPGAVAAMNAPSVMRRSDVYGANPHEFDPERWLPQPGESEEAFRARRARMDRALLAFGAGSRVCIGRNLVQLELLKIWPVLIKNYKFEPVGEVKLHDVLVRVTKRE